MRKMNKLLEVPARILAGISVRIALKRNNYKVIGITGSTGKTSTKEAITLVLKTRYRVLSSEREGYNTEFGLPLILFEKKAPKNRLGWFIFILFSPILALKRRDYDFCVLEMGADKPGDIEHLTKIVNPDVAVVTSVLRVHLAEFKNIEQIAEEKEKILAKLGHGDVAILNVDNEYVRNMKTPGKAETITYGKESTGVKIVKQEFDIKGSSNYFKSQGKDIVIRSSSLGEHLLYVFACAIAVGISQKIELKHIIKALESFKPVKGRLNLIEGINGSSIIDDSYNANPASMKNALDVLGKVDAKRKIALLGSMNDLANHEESEHKKIGAYLVGKCDILVVVGEAAQKYILPSAVTSGIKKEKTNSLKDSVAAGEFLKGIMKEGDLVLVKGSQNKIRLERAVKIIMKNPEDAQNLLCRQGKDWERRN